MTTLQQHDHQAQAHRDRWRALSVTLLVGYMSLLDVTIVNVAVPSIESGLGASAQAVQWIVSGYALTFGLTLVAGGRLGDVVGRRRMFLVGLVAFTLTSAMAGAAPTVGLVVAARLLQGAAAGFLTPQNSGLIQQLFSGPERARAFGLFGTTVGLSAASGPLLGGAILAAFGEQDGWRYVFFVNVPIGVVAMVLAARWLPRRQAREGSLAAQVDGVGALLLGASVVAVLLPLVEAMGHPATPWWFLALLAPVLAGAFTAWERRMVRRGRPPLLDVRLFREAPGYASGIVLGLVYFCGFSGIWLVLALYFQEGLGFTPIESGLAVTPFAVGSSVTSVVAGRLVERWGRWVTVTGLTLVTVGFAALAVVVGFTHTGHPALVVLLPLLVAGLGSGATISPNITMTLASVPPRMGGAAGGALQTGQRIGSAVGAAVLAAGYRIAVTAGLGHGPSLAAALACALAFTLASLGLAVREVRVRRRCEPGPECEEQAKTGAA